MADRDGHDLSRFERYRDLIGDWSAFADAMRRPLPACVWANPLRLNRGALAGWFDACGVQTREVPWSEDALRIVGHPPLGNLFPYMTGLCHVQEEVSLLPSTALAPRPGERVLDTCAAPGGKAAHAAAQMRNQGTLVANDRSFGRLRAVRGTIDRLGLTNVAVTCANAAGFTLGVGRFDRAMVDAPCSSEGTARKNRRVFFDAAPDYAALGGLQRAILKRALELVRPGGRVVYSTCTFAPEENERVVHQALGELGFEVAVVPYRPEGLVCSPGLTSWEGQEFGAQLANAVRVWPHQQDTGGFFVAVLERGEA
jgi:16S rRNA C967 or C1407 C5-methylase (RsmB/RsmF family)